MVNESLDQAAHEIEKVNYKYRANVGGKGQNDQLISDSVTTARVTTRDLGLPMSNKQVSSEVRHAVHV